MGMRTGFGIMTCLLLLACDRVPQGDSSQPALPTKPATLPAAPGAAVSAQPALPADVTAFVERRELCDHFRGEEAYDAERGAFLNKNIKALCTGSDAALTALRRKYAGNRQVIARLAGFELRIE